MVRSVDFKVEMETVINVFKNVIPEVMLIKLKKAIKSNDSNEKATAKAEAQPFIYDYMVRVNNRSMNDGDAKKVFYIIL